MKFSAACLQVLSLATIATAAPSTLFESRADTIPMPPVGSRPKAISFEEAQAAMQANASTKASVAASKQEASGIISVQAGCRNTIYKHWGGMSSQERTNYVNAVKCLMNPNTPKVGIWSGARSVYDEIVWVHGQMNADIHQSDIFLPWHRYYLFILRNLLNSKCGFGGPYPWWQETLNTGNFAGSDIFSTQWYGPLPQRVNGGGYCVTSGAFAGISDRNTNQCVARGEDKSITNQVTVANENLCQGSQSNTFSQHAYCVERRNHALFHNGFGPTMANSAISPADPIFFLHHSYIDWQWKRWQNSASWRWSTITGCADRRSPCTALTRNTVLSSRGLFRSMTVGDILDSEGSTTCYTYDNLLT